MTELEEKGSTLSLDELIKLLMLIPFRGILMASFYFISLLIFNISLAKALIVSIFVFISLIANFADRLLARFGMVLFAYALAYWIEAAPSPAELRDFIMTGLRTALAATQSEKQ